MYFCVWKNFKVEMYCWYLPTIILRYPSITYISLIHVTLKPLEVKHFILIKGPPFFFFAREFTFRENKYGKKNVCY